MGPQLNDLLHVLNNKTEKQKEKDLKEKKQKVAGGSEQKLPSHPLPRAVATARVAPPPVHAVPVQPRPSPARIRWPRSSSPLSCAFPSLARSASPARRNPSYAARVLELRRRLTRAPRRHCPIAWARRSASSSSTSSPSHASRDAAVSSSSSKYRNYTAPSSSPIPATSGCPDLYRASERVEGEQPHVPDAFPLSLAL